MLAVKVPDTITSWVASAFALSNSSGLGISEPTSLKVFQPFFVSLTLPYSVIRGEEVSLIASVFNYESTCLTVSVLSAVQNQINPLGLSDKIKEIPDNTL